MTDRNRLLILLACAICALLLLLGYGLTADNYEYFLSRRMPKAAALVLAATAIALSSLAFQTITNNRILTPSVMGFDGLYMLSQVMIVFLLGGLSAFALDPYLNFVVCCALMLGFSFLLFGFYFRSGKRNLIVLLLLGVILSQLFDNLASMLIMMLDPNEFTAIQSSMFASFNNIKVELLSLSALVIACAALALLRMHHQLNVLWLDTDNATSLGVDVPAVTRRVMLLSSLLIAVATALVGPVLFFGLLVTNLTREWLQTYQHKLLLVGCVLIAVIALLIGQFVVEQMFHFQTTLSVVINFVGGLYFLRMLLKNKII